MTTTKKCQKCDITYEQSKNFCGKCGSALEVGVDSPAVAEESDKPMSTQERSKSRSRGLSLFLVIIFSVFCYFAYQKLAVKGTGTVTGPQGQAAMVAAEVVLRQGPGTKAARLGTLEPNIEVEVVGAETDAKGNLWNNVHVRSGPLSGQTGYVRPKYLALGRP